MATFQVSKKQKNKSNKNVKLIFGWVLLAVSTFVFLFSSTKLVPFLQYFFLGILGVFVYPLCVLGLFVSLALLNNKKYVMPKKYAIFLVLTLILFLSIIQLIIIGSPKDLSYGEYVLLNYHKQFTAGGLLIGFLPASLVKLMGLASTYVLLSVAFITCLAFFIEAVVSLRKTTRQQKPMKLQIKEKESRAPFDNKKETINIRNEKVFKNKDTNVVLNAYKEEEAEHEMSVREKLGLVGGHKKIYDNNKQLNLPEEKESKGKIPDGMTVREYLLSPPTVDMEKFIERVPKTKPKEENDFGTFLAPSKEEINNNINNIKENEEIKPNSFVYEENFDFSQNQNLKRGDLPELTPEEVTNEAEDIIRSVVEQEKLELKDENIDNNDDEPSINDNNQTFDRNREDFSQRRDDFGRREDLGIREDLGRRDGEILNNRQNDDFSRRNDSRDSILTNRENSDNNDFSRNKPPVDEMERRKRFVQLDDESDKQEIVKPYNYKRPSLDLITTKSDDLSLMGDEVPMKRVALENALENFGIPAKVQNVVIGPTVTRYEIEMPEGISVKKILSLDADIAYALSAPGQIRIEAPIPGRSIVGIEVPNSKVAKVSIKDVLQSKEFALSPSPLAFALGKNITGNVKVCNLQKMPHLLVAGTTGSGKSVCLNSIIISILYKASPDDVKFIMIDPKQVELSMYEGLPHMVIPKVITDVEKAVNALQWAVDEMERRFKLISEVRVRNIGEYNKTDRVVQNKIKKMPYIVIIFDEFADFMAIAKNEIDDKFRRLAGKARAAGIHLILATQHPSTDVVTGTLKANFPSRIAFKVASRFDSEVIIGSPGAEKLLGYGDMLYKPSDAEASRLQGCFIDTPETKDIVNYIITNNEEVFDEEAFNAINHPNKKNNSNGDSKDGVDPLLPQALKICIDNGVASSTMVQRKLSIGYPRAARIIDQMEERNYISSAEGNKQRSVYLTIEEFYAIFGDIYD